jgi:hypothetical protein
MERQGKFDNAKIGAEMTAGFGKGLNEEDTNLFGQVGHLCGAQALQVGRRVDGLQQCSHV